MVSTNGKRMPFLTQLTTFLALADLLPVNLKYCPVITRRASRPLGRPEKGILPA